MARAVFGTDRISRLIRHQARPAKKCFDASARPRSTTTLLPLALSLIDQFPRLRSHLFKPIHPIASIQSAVQIPNGPLAAVRKKRRPRAGHKGSSPGTHALAGVLNLAPLPRSVKSTSLPVALPLLARLPSIEEGGRLLHHRRAWVADEQQQQEHLKWKSTSVHTQASARAARVGSGSASG